MSAGNYSLAIFLATPLYLQKTIQLGGLIQATSAFTAVASAFSAFINQYSTLTQWRSIIARLNELKEVMNSAKQTVSPKLIIEKHRHDSIIIDNLTLLLPNGKKLLDKINLSFCAGGSFLIRGAAGLGKSTLLRAIAGLWPYGVGRIQLPETAKIFFLPQKIYLPMDSLRNILTYPNPYKVDDSILIKYLKFFGLQKLQTKLDEVRPWSQTLSLGEQQLISHIKVFLYRPDIIFLDEATSALDEAMEATFYTTLHLHLPKTTFISVGHKNSLNKFHDNIILFNPSLA